MRGGWGGGGGTPVSMYPRPWNVWEDVNKGGVGGMMANVLF